LLERKVSIDRGRRWLKLISQPVPKKAVAHDRVEPRTSARRPVKTDTARKIRLLVQANVVIRFAPAEQGYLKLGIETVGDGHVIAGGVVVATKLVVVLQAARIQRPGDVIPARRSVQPTAPLIREFSPGARFDCELVVVAW
jgi:hypothetical protein